MSELIKTVKDFIQIAAEEEYLIDKVIMSDKCATTHINELQDFLNIFLLKIETQFPGINNFKYRRVILPIPTNPEEEGTIKLDRETWGVMKSSKYKHGGYEVYLKREK